MGKLSELRKEGSFEKVKNFVNKLLDIKYKNIFKNENENEDILILAEYFKKIKNTVLVVAAHTDNFEVADAMLFLGADPNKAYKFSYGCNSIILAVMNRSYKMLELLINKSQSKLDLNIRVCKKVCVNNGKTALNLICCDKTNNGLKILKLLIDNNADINLQDLDGNSNLLIAVNNDNNTALSYLLKKGADPNLTSFCCWRSPLMAAASYGNEFALQYLIDFNANLDLTEKHNGYTALMCSLLEGNLECAKILAENNCDLNIEDNDGYSALRIAVRKDYREIITGLVMIGSKVDQKIINDAKSESTKIFLENSSEIRSEFVKRRNFGDIKVIKEKIIRGIGDSRNMNKAENLGNLKVIQKKLIEGIENDENKNEKKIKNFLNLNCGDEKLNFYCYEINRSGK